MTVLGRLRRGNIYDCRPRSGLRPREDDASCDLLIPVPRTLRHCRPGLIPDMALQCTGRRASCGVLLWGSSLQTIPVYLQDQGCAHVTRGIVLKAKWSSLRNWPCRLDFPNSMLLNLSQVPYKTFPSRLESKKGMLKFYISSGSLRILGLPPPDVVVEDESRPGPGVNEPNAHGTHSRWCGRRQGDRLGFRALLRSGGVPCPPPQRFSKLKSISRALKPNIVAVSSRLMAGSNSGVLRGPYVFFTRGALSHVA